jgi:hypothetical protein
MRTTGSIAQISPDRARNTGSISQISQDRPRPTGSLAVAKPLPFSDRERATSPQRPPGKGLPPKGKAAPVPSGPGLAGMTDHQKRMLGSAFQDSKRMNAMQNAIGTAPGLLAKDDDDEEETALGPLFDGVTPARELTSRDLFKAVQAPVQSREGRRSRQVLKQVVNQFAVGHNPRYQPDGPGNPRSHIFIWDVSRAMNVEVPHFVGAKELSLGQTCDWLRHEGPTRGWIRAAMEDAAGYARQGLLVIAMPREIRLKHLAVVSPDAVEKDGRPRLSSCSVKLGNNLSVYDALGVYAADFFVHA